MTDPRTAPYAAFILRLSLGLMFLAHAGVKLFVFTPSGTAGFFGQLGLPPALAYVVIAAELLGAAALIAGVWPRLAALALAPILLGAIATVHGGNGWLFTNAGGGWEYPAFWAVGLVALALVGDGAWALVPTPAFRPAAQPRIA
ncbi:MAG TPA: DoxX family protein [Acetobacteraceae bacterium]